MADRLVLFVFGVCILVLFDSICIVVFLSFLVSAIVLALEKDDPTATVQTPAPKGFGWMFDTVGQEVRAKSAPRSMPSGGPRSEVGTPSSSAPWTMTSAGDGGTTDYGQTTVTSIPQTSYYSRTTGSLRPPQATGGAVADRRQSIAPGPTGPTGPTGPYPPNMGSLPRPSYGAGMPNHGLPRPATPYQIYPLAPTKQPQ